MQVILTEEEYNTLKIKASNTTFYITECNRLKQQLVELQSKYDKLLIHGVVTSNEQLKSTLK